MSTKKWRTVLLSFLAFNCAMGFTFGTFGPLIASLEAQFGISRTAAASAMSITTLAMGLSSPFIGELLQRLSIRLSMFGGLALAGLSFWGLALTPSFSIALIFYGMIGIGVSTAAVIGPVTLISRWFFEGRGKIIGIAMMPLFSFLLPIVIAELLPIMGRMLILETIGSICLLVSMLMLLIVDNPPRGTLGSASEDMDRAQESFPKVSANIFLLNPIFWLTSIPIGILAGSGIVYTVHIIPFATQMNMSSTEAALMLSFEAGTAIPAVLLMGWLVDRIGPIRVLMINFIILSLTWWVLTQLSGFSLFIAAVMVGLTVTPVFVIHGSAFSKIFGAQNVSRAMGLSYSIKLPFIFFMAPLVGYFFDLSHNYKFAFTLMIGISLFGAAMAAVAELLVRRAGSGAGAKIA